MTAVLPTSRLSGYTHDASTLLSISDTDNESSYSPNAASPLILIPGAPSPGAGSCSRSTSGLFSGTRNGRDNMSSSTTGPNDYSSSHRGRCRGDPAGCETRHSSTHEEHEEEEEQEQERERAQLSIVAMLLDTVRRSLMASCQAVEEDAPETLEIGWPTDVQHVAHVTFDRYNGFLGLPEEFVVEVPPRAPSASQNVFGVSAESMQCAFDSKGNSVPMILLLMQERLYHEGGLKAEGIFRINAENSHEEHVRDQLNKGIVPADIDVHCLAGLIKAWFRELPQGILDVFTADQVMDCNTEEESVALVRLLPPTQAALLDWAVNLMADVVQQESSNKMNARNIAMVFAPNMTQMADPLTALMHAVQVMNLLKTLIIRTLRDRQEPVLEDQHGAPAPETSEGDEPDSDSGGVLLNGHERHSSAPTVDTKVGYDQYSHRIIIPPKRGSSKAKPKSGRLESTDRDWAEATSERVPSGPQSEALTSPTFGHYFPCRNLHLPRHQLDVLSMSTFSDSIYSLSHPVSLCLSRVLRLSSSKSGPTLLLHSTVMASVLVIIVLGFKALVVMLTLGLIFSFAD